MSVYMIERTLQVFFSGIFILCLGHIYGQDSDKCLSIADLQQLHHSNDIEATQFLTHASYMLVAKENSTEYVWHEDSLTFHLSYFQQRHQAISIYHNEDCHNIIEYVTSESCFEHLSELCQKMYTKISSQLSSGNISIFQVSPSQAIIFNSIPNNAQNYFISYINPNELDSLRHLHNLQKQNLLKEIDSNETKIKLYLAEADSFANQALYKEAIQHLEEIYFLSPKHMPQLDEKIGEYQQADKKQRIEKHTTEAETCVHAGMYHKALELYNKVLNEDMNNAHANSQIEMINKKIDILDKRESIIFRYDEINQENFDSIKVQLELLLDQFVSSVTKGEINSDFNINFDTAGTNQSYYLIHSYELYNDKFKISELQTNLTKLLSSPALAPSYLEDIKVGSAYEFVINLKWNYYQQKVRKSKKKIEYVDTKFPVTDIATALQQDSVLLRGLYIFSIRDKQVGNALFQDITITKYKPAESSKNKKAAKQFSEAVAEKPYPVKSQIIELEKQKQ